MEAFRDMSLTRPPPLLSWVVSRQRTRRFSVTRDFLTCEGDFPTEGGWIGDNPDQENPPGHELAVFVHEALRGATTRLSEIWNEEGYGWAFNCDWDRVTINVLVQRIDHWLIICSIVSLMPRFLRSRRYNEALSALCYHLDGLVRADKRFNNVRWFAAAESEQSEPRSGPVREWRTACDFRSREGYRRAIYFHCGDLNLYPQSF
jgi:hypothetical protein